MLGGFFALLSAATFALNQAGARRGVLTGTVIQALCITVPIGAPFFLLIAFIFGSAGDIFTFSSSAYFWLCLAGINHFIAGRYFNYWAVQNMGTNLTGPIQQLDIVVSLSLAIWLLGEYLTPLRLIGIALIIFTPLFTMRGDIAQARGKGPKKLKFTPQLGKGYLGAILSGIAYGISPILVRTGLQDATPQASLAGGAISYAAATAVLFAFVVLTGRTREVLSMDRTAARWFAFAGIFVGFAQVFRYAALALVPVAVVAPILRVGLVFRLIFSWMLNRDHEVFSPGVIVATFLSLFGALLLSISTDIFLSHVPLPQWAVEIIQWRWP
ncbi:MAG: EamA family transporter [Beijerinckiaceae bacterium]